MVNELLREIHVWQYGKRFCVVDTYYQEVLSEHPTVRDAFDAVRELRGLQKGRYPSIVEAS